MTALSDLSAVFLLSACRVMTMKWLWQSPLEKITDAEYQQILQMIAETEYSLMSGFAIGQIMPTVSDLSSYINVLALDGSTVLQADYPELTGVVPASWLVGADIQLPNMNETGVHGEDGTNLGDVVGENAVTLQISEIPSHTHVQNAHSHSYTQTSAIPTAAGLEPTFADLTTNFPSVTGNTVATNQNTGGDGAHNNIPRSLAVRWWIVAS